MDILPAHCALLVRSSSSASLLHAALDPLGIESAVGVECFDLRIPNVWEILLDFTF